MTWKSKNVPDKHLEHGVYHGERGSGVLDKKLFNPLQAVGCHRSHKQVKAPAVLSLVQNLKRLWLQKEQQNYFQHPLKIALTAWTP